MQYEAFGQIENNEQAITQLVALVEFIQEHVIDDASLPYVDVAVRALYDSPDCAVLRQIRPFSSVLQTGDYCTNVIQQVILTRVMVAAVQCQHANVTNVLKKDDVRDDIDVHLNAELPHLLTQFQSEPRVLEVLVQLMPLITVISNHDILTKWQSLLTSGVLTDIDCIEEIVHVLTDMEAAQSTLQDTMTLLHTTWQDGHDRTPQMLKKLTCLYSRVVPSPNDDAAVLMLTTDDEVSHHVIDVLRCYLAQLRWMGKTHDKTHILHDAFVPLRDAVSRHLSLIFETENDSMDTDTTDTAAVLLLQEAFGVYCELRTICCLRFKEDEDPKFWKPSEELLSAIQTYFESTGQNHDATLQSFARMCLANPDSQTECGLLCQQLSRSNRTSDGDGDHTGSLLVKHFVSELSAKYPIDVLLEHFMTALRLTFDQEPEMDTKALAKKLLQTVKLPKLTSRSALVSFCLEGLGFAMESEPQFAFVEALQGFVDKLDAKGKRDLLTQVQLLLRDMDETVQEELKRQFQEQETTPSVKVFMGFCKQFGFNEKSILV